MERPLKMRDKSNTQLSWQKTICNNSQQSIKESWLKFLIVGMCGIFLWVFFFFCIIIFCIIALLLQCLGSSLAFIITAKYLIQIYQRLKSVWLNQVFIGNYKNKLYSSLVGHTKSIKNENCTESTFSFDISWELTFIYCQHATSL